MEVVQKFTGQIHHSNVNWLDKHVFSSFISTFGGFILLNLSLALSQSLALSLSMNLNLSLVLNLPLALNMI